MNMNDFFKNYEIVVEQDGGAGVAINNMPLFQSFPEFNGQVHIFRNGEEMSLMSVESISKESLLKFIKSYKPGATYVPKATVPENVLK